MSESDRTLREIAEAELVPDMGGENGYLLRFAENDYGLVAKNGKNTLLVKHDAIDPDTDQYFVGSVTVELDWDGDNHVLHRGGRSTTVPDSKSENVLWAVYDEDEARLERLFDEHYTETVRQGIADMLMPRFRDHGTDIEKTDDGWVVTGDILVSWEGDNHPVDVAQTHVVQGSSTVEADTDKQAREISFDIPDDTTVTLPNGTETELNETEVEFFTTVGLILGRSGGGLYDDVLTSAVENSSVTGFTDTKSGLYHAHDLQKHTLDMLGVTDEAIDRLWYHDYDHTGVHEMALRRDEFENAPISVFDDAPNDDAGKWEKIESTREQAPIPQHVRDDLEERYAS